MASTGPRGAVLARARELVAAGVAGDEFLRTHGRLRRPLVVSHPHGGMHSWLVPMTIGSSLVGLLQLSSGLELLRFTMLQRSPGTLEGAPEMAAWLTPARVRSAARAIMRPSETPGETVLTYDQVPDRLAWRVEARSEDGSVRTIMVAGGVAYEPVDLDGSVGGHTT